MREILIAAGLGTRLGPHTAETPKCLLPVAGKPMLAHQIAAFRACGINDIVVINGFQAERFPADFGVTYVTNTAYRQNNILNSLMCAEPYMKDGFLAPYSDLVYEPKMVQSLLDAPGEVVAPSTTPGNPDTRTRRRPSRRSPTTTDSASATSAKGSPTTRPENLSDSSRSPDPPPPAS